jgi:hypothetical protein
MHKKQYFPIVPVILFVQNAVAFDFEVECDKNIATEPAVSDYFQKYIGKWTGEWKKDEYFNFYPDRVKKIADRFNYGDKFTIEVVSIKGCDIALKVHYNQDKDDFTLYKEEVMTEEGLYIYWNSPTIDGTYILIYDEKHDVLDGALQLFEGQNIASIEMKRL